MRVRTHPTQGYYLPELEGKYFPSVRGRKGSKDRREGEDGFEDLDVASKGYSIFPGRSRMTRECHVRFL